MSYLRTFMHGKNLKFFFYALNWEHKICMQNETEIYGQWMTNDILFLLVQEKP